MEEKRRSPRINANLRMTFRKDKSYLVTGAHTKDISETGLCMPLNLHFPVNSLLEVAIPLDVPKASIKTLARVTRSTNRVANITDRNNDRYRFDVGLEFLDLPTDIRNILHDYIHYHMPQEKND